MEVRQLAPGLWEWASDRGRSFYWEGEDAICLVDPVVPDEPDESARLWTHLDRDVARTGLPVAVALTRRSGDRSTPSFVVRYEASLHGPGRGLDELPGGLIVVAGGAGDVAYRIPSSPPVVVGRVGA